VSITQELLAVRLTDGSNADAARARQAFVLTVAAGGGAADPDISGFAESLADYYDDSICALVGRLGESPMLAQIRGEALSARMIAVLHAIERHTAALSARPALRTEADFLTRYRAHVLDQHGKLEPPDFERRRRVPIADIYVPTVIYEELYPERTVVAVAVEPPSLTVWDLAARLDRSVLLGDPGGGKTTASTVLMHHFASDAGRRVPLLVTLRNFAAEDPPARSVVGHIEHVLETLYQCPAPPGLVDLLLLTGRAVVLFDGLDELLDPSRRADVATRVEQFCIEYPLAVVLVTSRVVGYDQARLDERHFTSYRLGGLGDEDVAEYARKWFALEDGARDDDADAFLTESESVPDLRANPLLLSLMCILYRCRRSSSRCSGIGPKGRSTSSRPQEFPPTPMASTPSKSRAGRDRAGYPGLVGVAHSTCLSRSWEAWRRGAY
jgi:predicted NACHT family NTPase